MMSSWISAQAWTSSSAEQAVSTAVASGACGSPPAPSHPVHANAGLVRFPPRSTNCSSASVASTKTGPRRSVAGRRVAKKLVRASSTAVTKAGVPGCGTAGRGV
jgi:hypothetical protein